MDPFTQKLLERTKARKDALTKKRQEWEHAAMSDAENSRLPLRKKDLNESDSSAGIRDIKNVFENPKVNPTTRSKRQSPTKESAPARVKKSRPAVQPSESMIGAPRSGRTARDAKRPLAKESSENLFERQKKINNSENNPSSTRKGREHRGNGSATVTNESIQERLSRLEEQKRLKAEEVAEQKRKRQNDIENTKMARERLYKTAREKDKIDVKRHSASIDDKLAMFENVKDGQLTDDIQPEISSRLHRMQPPKAVYNATPSVAESDTDGYEAGLDDQTEDETDVIPTESEFEPETDFGETDVGETDTDIYETEDDNAFDISAILKTAEAEQNTEAESNINIDYYTQSTDEISFKEPEKLPQDPIVVDISYNKKNSHKKKQPPKKPARTFSGSNSDLESDPKPHISSPNKKPNDYLSPIKKGDYVNVDSGSPLVKTSSSTNKRRMRRSISFSEGQGKPLFKSGYNEEASKNYDANTNCSNEVVVELSNKEKIQDLLEEAASQQNIVLQTSQALNVNEYDDKQGSPEVIEGHRLLLLATEKKNACLEEVQMLKKNGSRKAPAKKEESSIPPCKAKLVISEVKLPLNHEFMKALRSGKIDLGVFHFVVLVQYGPKKVYATSAVSSFDAVEANCIPLASKIVIHDVPHDFRLTIKVFGMHTKRPTDLSGKGKKVNTKDNNGRMKNVISSLTPRKKASVEELQASNASPKTVFRTSNFMPVGQTKIDVTMIRSEKHVLCKVPGNCPLDGFIQLRVDCLPQFTAQARGFLTIFQDVGGYTAWNRRWCSMHGNTISYWRYPDEESSKGPLGEIDLKWVQNTTVGLVSRDQCARPNTFEIIFKKPLNQHDKPGILSTVEGKNLVTKCWISTDTKDDRSVWLTTINRQLSDYNAWSDLDKPSSKGIHAFHVVNPCNRYNDARNSPISSVYV